MPEPINMSLYERARHMANRKFGAGPGLYKSAWMVHEYVKMGGRYRGKRSPHHGLVASFEKLHKSKSKKSKSRSIKSNSKSKSRKSKSMKKRSVGKRRYMGEMMHHRLSSMKNHENKHHENKHHMMEW